MTGELSGPGAGGTATDIEEFWRSAARRVHWINKPVLINDETGSAEARPSGWFADGTLNACFNAADRHVALGRADDVALVVDQPVPGAVSSYTYADLTEQAAKFAGVLRALGVASGDTVVICGSPAPEVVIAILATTRIGAIHFVIAPPDPVTTVTHLVGCLDAVAPAAVVSLSRSRSIASAAGDVIDYRTAIETALSLTVRRPPLVLVSRDGETLGAAATHSGERDRSGGPPAPDVYDYRQLMRSSAIQPAECVSVPSSHPLGLLLATGDLRDGLLTRSTAEQVVGLQWVMDTVFGVGPGDLVYTRSGLGSELGQSYSIYAPLYAGAASLLVQDTAAPLDRLTTDHRITALIGDPAVEAPAIRKRFVTGPSADTGASTGTGTGTGTGASTDTGPSTDAADGWGAAGTGWPLLAERHGLGRLRTLERQRRG